jgi:hypothetical protein
MPTVSIIARNERVNEITAERVSSSLQGAERDSAARLSLFHQLRDQLPSPTRLVRIHRKMVR